MLKVLHHLKILLSRIVKFHIRLFDVNMQMFAAGCLIAIFCPLVYEVFLQNASNYDTKDYPKLNFVLHHKCLCRYNLKQIKVHTIWALKIMSLPA